MGFKYRDDVDILQMLKDAGYSTYRVQKEGILGSGTITKIRRKQMVSLTQIDTLCNLLKCRPNDIIEYIPEYTS